MSRELPHEDARLWPDNGRYLAEQIPGAHLLELPGVDHDPCGWATDDILAAVEGVRLRDRARPARAAVPA